MNTFVANFHSESGDRYSVPFSANRAPETDEEWLSIIEKELPGEFDIAQTDPGGCGLGDTYLHLESLIEVGTPARHYVF